MIAFLAVFAVSHLSLAEPLSIARKTEIPLVQEKAMTRAVLGGVVGTGLGALMRQLAGRDIRDTSVLIYPTVGIGSYSAAPALMFEGRF